MQFIDATQILPTNYDLIKHQQTVAPIIKITYDVVCFDAKKEHFNLNLILI